MYALNVHVLYLLYLTYFTHAFTYILAPCRRRAQVSAKGRMIAERLRKQQEEEERIRALEEAEAQRIAEIEAAEAAEAARYEGMETTFVPVRGWGEWWLVVCLCVCVCVCV